MTESDVRTVYIRDDSSGRIHARVYVDGNLLSDERDNADDAGSWHQILQEDAMDAPEEFRCKRCFPETIDPVDSGRNDR